MPVLPCFFGELTPALFDLQRKGWHKILSKPFVQPQSRAMSMAGYGDLGWSGPVGTQAVRIDPC
jgi:hypothetical protein